MSARDYVVTMMDEIDAAKRNGTQRYSSAMYGIFCLSSEAE